MSSPIFEAGERVLCYEPDPNKVRVVYDAKILEVADDEEIDDGESKKYLVHFQGWSSNWDRFVSKDFLLKDTDENREKQRELFDQAEECIRPAKKKKKKRKNASEGSVPEHSVHQSPSATASGAATADLDVSDPKLTAARTRPEDEDELGAVEGGGVVPLNLSEALRRHLEQDFNQVVKRRRLNPVPADTNIVSVLESFARHYTHSKLSSGESGKTSFSKNRKEKSKENFERIVNCVNVCKEVLEGLRIMVDFYMESQLLYENERQQYKKAMSKPLPARLQHPQQGDDANWSVPIKNAAVKLPLIGKYVGSRSSRSCSEEPAVKSSRSSESGRSTPTLPPGKILATPSGNNSHASARELTSAMHEWRLLARGGCPVPQEPLPSLLYGPIYLLRLFVKVPEILGKMKMPKRNSRLLVKIFTELLEFVESNSEFFGDLYE